MDLASIGEIDQVDNIARCSRRDGDGVRTN